jgi:hypothetical protein
VFWYGKVESSSTSDEGKVKMFTALNPVEFAEVMSVGRHIPTAWESKSDLEKANCMDVLGDAYKAKGDLARAKYCYGRASKYAAKWFA